MVHLKLLQTLACQKVMQVLLDAALWPSGTRNSDCIDHRNTICCGRKFGVLCIGGIIIFFLEPRQTGLAVKCDDHFDFIGYLIQIHFILYDGHC